MLFRCIEGYRKGDVLQVDVVDLGFEKWGKFVAGYKNNISPSNMYPYRRLLKSSVAGLVMKFDKCIWAGEGK